MRPYLLIENNWKNLSTDRARSCKCLGVPRGHNYHLPTEPMSMKQMLLAQSLLEGYEKG